jgi:hypothetical protein
MTLIWSIVVVSLTPLLVQAEAAAAPSEPFRLGIEVVLAPGVTETYEARDPTNQFLHTAERVYVALRSHRNEPASIKVDWVVEKVPGVKEKDRRLETFHVSLKPGERSAVTISAPSGGFPPGDHYIRVCLGASCADPLRFRVLLAAFEKPGAGARPADVGRPKPATEEVFGTKEEICYGLKGDIYFIEEGTRRLPDFSTLRPVGTVYATQLNITPRSFRQGFPGVTGRFEWFAIDYNSRFLVEQAGMYRFRVNSDDGAKIFIDNWLIIDNDGIHGPAIQESAVPLQEGAHRIRVEYFQGPRVQVALVLEIAGEGESFHVLSFRDMAAPCPKTGALRVATTGQGMLAAPAQVELILDASGSMKRKIAGRMMIDVAKDVLIQIINDLPDGVRAALRVYGHRIREGRPGDCKDSELLLPFGRVNKAHMAARVRVVKALGTTPIAYSLGQIAQDFGTALGEKMVILITDGKEECKGSPLAAVSELIAKGFRVRLNVVGFALSERATKQEMEHIARLTGGKFFDAKDARALDQAIKQALAAPYDVFDTEGVRCGSGVTGQDAIRLPEGTYTVVVHAAGAPITIRSVRIANAVETKVVLESDGQKTAPRVVGP